MHVPYMHHTCHYIFTPSCTESSCLTDINLYHNNVPFLYYMYLCNFASISVYRDTRSIKRTISKTSLKELTGKLNNLRWVVCKTNKKKLTCLS